MNEHKHDPSVEEVVAADFEEHEVDDEGYPYVVDGLPPELPFDEAVCSEEGCETSVGYVYTVSEDRFGREIEGARWAETHRVTEVDVVRYICGDCAYQRDLEYTLYGEGSRPS